MQKKKKEKKYTRLYEKSGQAYRVALTAEKIRWTDHVSQNLEWREDAWTYQTLEISFFTRNWV